MVNMFNRKSMAFIDIEDLTYNLPKFFSKINISLDRNSVPEASYCHVRDRFRCSRKHLEDVGHNNIMFEIVSSVIEDLFLSSLLGKEVTPLIGNRFSIYEFVDFYDELIIDISGSYIILNESILKELKSRYKNDKKVLFYHEDGELCVRIIRDETSLDQPQEWLRIKLLVLDYAHSSIYFMNPEKIELKLVQFPLMETIYNKKEDMLVTEIEGYSKISYEDFCLACNFF